MTYFGLRLVIFGLLKLAFSSASIDSAISSSDSGGFRVPLQQERALRVGTVGFRSSCARRVLNSILAHPLRMDSDDEPTSAGPAIYQLQTESRIPILVTGEPSIGGAYSDIAMIYLDRSDLYDHNIVLHKLQQSLRSMVRNPFVKRIAESLAGVMISSQTDGVAAAESERGKVPLMIVFSGSTADADLVEVLLRQAWALMDEGDGSLSSSNLFALFDVQIIMVPSQLRSSDDAPEATNAVRRSLLWCVGNNESDAAPVDLRTVKQCLEVDQLDAADESATDDHVSDDSGSADASRSGEIAGLELAQEGAAVALDWAINAARESVARLGRVSNPRDFRGFVENLLVAAESILRKRVLLEGDKQHPLSTAAVAANTAGGVSAAALKLAEADLRKNIFERLLPLYRQQIRRLRQQMLSEFNNKVSTDSVASPDSDDAMELTVFIMDDLRKLKQDTLRAFTRESHQLLPKHAPRSLWSADFDAFELESVVEEYLQRREAEYRALGVLDRGGEGLRKPVDVSFHVFVPHPLGLRDYRQDVLGGVHGSKSRDQLLFAGSGGSSGSGNGGGIAALPAVYGIGTAASDALLNPAVARRALQKEIASRESDATSQQQSNRLSLSACRERSEFAREMMMLPLSINSPPIGKDAASSSKGRRGKGSKRAAGSAAAGAVASDSPAAGFVFNDIGSGAGGPPRKDSVRARLGPERFLSWDFPPLNEAKFNLDALLLRSSAQNGKTVTASDLASALFSSLDTATETVNKATLTIPGLDVNYYKSPPIAQE